jgi:ABC-type Zn uptake system ZnuABC Zn-binding protein ZnuA
MRVWAGLLAGGLVVALTIAAAGACGGGDGSGEGKLRVVASTAIAEALARAVGGEAVEVHVLAGAGVDPHDFELSPQDRRSIEQAVLLVRIGLGVDRFVDGVPQAKLVTLSEGLALRRADGSHADDDDDHADGEEHDEYDPHVWHDPENCKQMAMTLAERLAEADPQNAGLYRANAAAFGARMDAADAEIRALIEAIPAENRKVVSNHDSLGYFFDRYGLGFVGAVIPGTGTSAEPSAGQIADLIATIRREGVKAIFAEQSVNASVARQVARDTGVKIVDDLYGDSLGPEGSGAETIEGMLVTNARKIAAALR